MKQIDEDLRLWLFDITNEPDLNSYNDIHLKQLENMMNDIVRIVIHPKFPPPEKYKAILPKNPVKFECLQSNNNKFHPKYNYNLKRDLKWYYPIGVPVDYDNYPKPELEIDKENELSENKENIKPNVEKEDDGKEKPEIINEEAKKDDNFENEEEKEEVNENENGEENNEGDIIGRINNKIDNLEPITTKEEIYNILMNQDELLNNIVQKYNENNNSQLFYILLNISLEYPEFRYSIISQIKLKYNSLRFKIIDSVRKGKELYLWNKDIRDKGIQLLSDNFDFIPTIEY